MMGDTKIIRTAEVPAILAAMDRNLEAQLAEGRTLLVGVGAMFAYFMAVDAGIIDQSWPQMAVAVSWFVGWLPRQIARIQTIQDQWPGLARPRREAFRAHGPP